MLMRSRSASPSKALLPLAMIGLATLTACSEPELILPGERIAVLPELAVVEINADAASQGANLGEVRQSNLFGHAGGMPGHAGGHLSFEWPPAQIWQASVAGVKDDIVELAQPIIAHDRVYALGADGMLHAFDLNNGDAIWQMVVEVLDDDPLAGVMGGIAANDKMLMAHASQRDLVSIDIETGEMIWAISHNVRLKGGPTLLGDEAVMVTDINGRLYVYDAEDGTPLWERSGLPSNTVVFGAPAPAFAGSEVVLAGSGGEISVYDPTTGDLLWADSLASFNPRTPLQELGDVRAHPVHDGKLIFVISQSGRMIAYQAATGIELWEQPITSIEQPWVAGDTIYVVTLDGRLYALRRGDGQARWMVELPGAFPVGEITSDNVPRYVSPLVANGNVMVISRKGKALVFDAMTGEKQNEFSLSGSFTTAPALASGALAVVNAQGKLVLYR